MLVKHICTKNGVVRKDYARSSHQQQNIVDYNQNIGQRIQEAFGYIPNARIAHQLGAKPTTAQHWLKNNRLPDYETLIKISELTQCNLHWLLTGRGSMTSEENTAGDHKSEFEPRPIQIVLDNLERIDQIEIDEIREATFSVVKTHIEMYEKRRQMAKDKEQLEQMEKRAEGAAHKVSEAENHS